jgi:hypothetical protein
MMRTMNIEGTCAAKRSLRSKIDGRSRKIQQPINPDENREDLGRRAVPASSKRHGGSRKLIVIDPSSKRRQMKIKKNSEANQSFRPRKYRTAAFFKQKLQTNPARSGPAPNLSSY